MLKRAAALLVSLLLVAGVGDAFGGRRPIGRTKVFVRVPEPGNPEGIAIRKGRLFVGTHAPANGNREEGPSKIFIYKLATGKKLRTVKVRGQNTDETHGILGMAFDGAGRLYVLDRNPARMLRFSRDLARQKTYATFPDLKPCHSNPAPCSPTEADAAPFPDYFAFDKAGNAYVTDLEAATIFKVLPGGGEAAVWFQDARLDSLFGPNGIALSPKRKKIYFAMTGSVEPTRPAQGIIYTLPLVDDPNAEDLREFFVYPESSAGPDGIAFGKSGKLYVALAGSNQISILRRDGTEAHRFPSVTENEQRRVPYDLPASLAFDGNGWLLVTNQSFFADNPEHYVVLKAWVNDTALPLVRPRI